MQQYLKVWWFEISFRHKNNAGYNRWVNVKIFYPLS